MNFTNSKLPRTKHQTQQHKHQALFKDLEASQEVIIVKDELRAGQPIMMRSSKLKTKRSSLCVIKEIRTDGTIELESPYSRRTKVVT